MNVPLKTEIKTLKLEKKKNKKRKNKKFGSGQSRVGMRLSSGQGPQVLLSFCAVLAFGFYLQSPHGPRWLLGLHAHYMHLKREKGKGKKTLPN